MNPALNPPPPRTEIAAMEPFAGLGLDAITRVMDREQAESAFEILMAAGSVGFDTESKPTFRKGEQSEGPHVFQFATLERAFIFQTHVEASRDVILELLANAQLTKIGFDLRGDLRQISQKFNVTPASTSDLGRAFRQLGYRNTIGATSAVAMLFKRRLHKAKFITTSNWAATELSEKQLIYAANDAYAAICVFHALQNRTV